MLHSEIKFKNSIVLLVFIVFGILTGVVQKLPLPPQSVHNWAQSDRAAVALLFFEEDMNLFLPKVLNLNNGTGYTGMELPLVNYMAAVLYKCFGFHSFWYRLVVMLIVAGGFWAAFKMACMFLENHLAAMTLTLTWYLSPVILYYTPNFLADAASMGWILMGWYFFFSYTRKPSISHWIGLTLFCSLAPLVKVTSIISVICMLALVALDYLRLITPEKKETYSGKLYLIVALMIPLALTFSWYTYAKHLNEIHFADTFHLGISPPDSFIHFKEIVNSFNSYFLTHYYSPVVLIAVLLLIFLLPMLFRFVNREIGILVFGLGIGNCAFMYLQFQKFAPHDYYMLTIFPWVFFLLLCTFILVKNNWDKIGTRYFKLIYAVFILSIIYNTYYCRKIIHQRYDNNNPAGYYEPAHQAYYDMEHLMREKGIRKLDTIISFTDVTTQLSLYLLKQKGYTRFDLYADHEYLHLIQHRGVNYVVNNSTNYKPNSFFLKVLGKPILTYKNISVYKPIKNSKIKQIADSVFNSRLQYVYEKIDNTDYWIDMVRAKANYLNLPVDIIKQHQALRWFRYNENLLTERFHAFCLSHQELTSEQSKNLFATNEHLNEDEKYIWNNPSTDWLKELENAF